VQIHNALNVLTANGEDELVKFMKSLLIGSETGLTGRISKFLVTQDQKIKDELFANALQLYMEKRIKI
jgi:hypothetical protein